MHKSGIRIREILSVAAILRLLWITYPNNSPGPTDFCIEIYRILYPKKSQRKNKVKRGHYALPLPNAPTG